MPSDVVTSFFAVAYSIFASFFSYTISTVFLGLATVATYRVFLHPLANIPGPRLAAVSNVWYAWQIRNGRAGVLGRTLHQKYGQIVRVGPNEIWFNTKDAFNAIYSTARGFDKSDFYLATALMKPDLDWKLNPQFPDTLDLLSERDMKRYRLQRRLVGRVYQPANLAKLEPAIDEALHRVVKTLADLNGEEVDLKEWMHMIAVECLGAAVLSWSPGMLKNKTDHGTSRHSYVSWRRKSVFGLFPLMSKLQYSSAQLNRAFALLWGVTFTTPKGFRPFFPEVGKRVSRRIQLIVKNQKQDGRKDLLADLIQLHQAKPEFTETYLRKMAVTNFGAGHETMASTLTSAMAMIGLHSSVQKEVAAEVRSAENPAQYVNATQLRVTRAAVREATRLHPVLSMSLPRQVSDTGMHLHGHFFPKGTTVGCNPIALHRNPDICGPEPVSYRPNRWLQDDEEALRAMDKYSLNWGGGSRTCPGRNLAELIVLKAIPAILQKFDVEIVMMPSEEEMPSYFLSMMTGVKVRFIRAGESS